MRASRSEVWAVTAYFPFDDPPGERRRLSAFKQFRRHLDVPLVAVELSQDGDFHLTRDDAEILVQLSEGDLMWQKERLLNVAVQETPAECEIVAWLDCDLKFADARWPQAAAEFFSCGELLQLYRTIRFEQRPRSDTDAGDRPPSKKSIASLWVEGRLPASSFGEPGSSARLQCKPGGAWAMRRERIAEIGLYDAMIVGGGDKALWAAACGYAADFAVGYGLGRRHARHYLQWAERFHNAVRGRVGCLDGEVTHLWHGPSKSGRYVDRHEGFGRLDFDPEMDLEIAASGAWVWRRNRPDLRQRVEEVFERRRG